MMVDFTRLDNSLLNDDLVKGFRAKTASEISAAKLAQMEKEEEIQHYLEESGMTANGKPKENKYEDRINNLFTAFEKNLPEDFKKYGSPHLDEPLKTVTDNIRGLAGDMHKLSELAGEDPELEKKAEKITANLLDRLKNDLELTPEERKKLEGKSLEEIRDYYAQTRSETLDKFDETVKTYRQEVQQVIEQAEGRSLEEKAKLFQDKLDDINWKTGVGEWKDLATFQGMSAEEASINDVRRAAIDSKTVSDENIKKKLEAALTEQSV